MKNIKLSKKFLLAFGTVILLLSIVASWSVTGIGKIITNAKMVIEANSLKANFEEKIVQHLEWSDKVVQFLTDDDVTELNIQTDNHECALGKWYYSDERKHAEKLLPELKTVFEKIDKPHEELHSSVIEIKKALTENKSDATDLQLKNAISIYRTKTQSSLSEVRKYLEESKKLVSVNVMTDEQMISSASNTKLAVLSFSIIASILAIIFAIIISRGIINPILKGIDASKKIALGDLGVNIDIHQEDEIGMLADAQRQMIQNLRETSRLTRQIANGDLTVTVEKRSDKDEFTQSLIDMIVKLKQVVSDVISNAGYFASSSEQISNTSMQIAQGSNEQASATEEVSTSMEEMAANIEQNTENANETEKISRKALDGIKEGKKSVDITVQAMKTIAEKISIIGEIAEKTDLLAINAAIEAARAGEHGKGFAVVAAEVRKLAERSQNAAKEIDEVSKVSVLDAEKSGQLLAEILPDIEKTAKLVQEIAAASYEQNSGAQQINSAMQQLSSVTQQNSASSEELSSGAEELTGQAQALKELVKYFKIDKEVVLVTKQNEKKEQNQIIDTKTYKEMGHIKNNEISGSNINDNDYEKY